MVPMNEANQLGGGSHDALVTGYLVHFLIGLPVLIALLFGCIISATDPISVLAIFKDRQWRLRKSGVNVRAASRPPNSCFATAIC